MLSLKNNVFSFAALWYFPEIYLAPGHKKVPHPCFIPSVPPFEYNIQTNINELANKMVSFSCCWLLARFCSLYRENYCDFFLIKQKLLWNLVITVVLQILYLLLLRQKWSITRYYYRSLFPHVCTVRSVRRLCNASVCCSCSQGWGLPLVAFSCLDRPATARPCWWAQHDRCHTLSTTSDSILL